MFRKILVVLLIALIATTASAQQESVRGGARDRAPVIDARDFNLEKYEGKVVVLAFWQALECAACESYVPWLAEMQTRYLEEGLVIVAVNQDLQTAAATDWLPKIHSRSEIVIDATRKLAANYQIKGVPSTLFFDRNLELAGNVNGFVPEESASLEKVIKLLVEQEYAEEE